MPMQTNEHTILVGENNLEAQEYFETTLRCLGYSVVFAQDGNEVIGHLQTPEAISAVLLDLVGSQRDGIEVLKQIRSIQADLPVIVVSAAASPLNIVTAMKNGATNFLCKPIPPEDLRKAINAALEDKPRSASPSAVPASSRGRSVFRGSDSQSRQIYSLMANVGRSDAPVLIQGETGSGKEVLARDLHNHSPRSGRIFLKLNCAALPSELVESELFGHHRGAFTGAFQTRIGMFEAASGGTIFLDEIGDMDIRLQAKLLQVLQDREFQRIGGRETIKVDVRIMAATHRDLEKSIADRTFREDLYYRLNVINIHLPPLRERKQDIIPMAEHLMRAHAPGTAVSISPELRNAMILYGWPGNVRELENIVRKLVVLRDPDLIARELNAKTERRRVAAANQSSLEALEVASGETKGIRTLEEVQHARRQAETEAIRAALNTARWNRKQAAALLKTDYKALLYKMKRLGVDNEDAGSTPSAAEGLGTALSVSAE
jgi:two-component system response regulator AtoC